VRLQTSQAAIGARVRLAGQSALAIRSDDDRPADPGQRSHLRPAGIREPGLEGRDGPDIEVATVPAESGLCAPSRIASTMSGAISVSRRTRVM